MTNQFLDWCRRERARANRGLESVTRGTTYYEAVGDAPYHDVTHERMTEWNETIREMDLYILAEETRLAGIG